MRRALAMTMATACSACGAFEPPAVPLASTDLTSAEYSAAYRIADNLCEREMSAGCATFASRSECLRAQLLTSASEARLQQCSDPINDNQVESCVAEIRRGTCGAPLSSHAACQQPVLCPTRSEEGTM